MFADDRLLVKELVAKYGPALQPIVDVGGLSRPCVAAYEKTIEAMAKLRWEQTHEENGEEKYIESVGKIDPDDVRAAQMCRYLDIERPLSFLGPHEIENPETGGVPIEGLSDRYPDGIGTAILLSVLEHVADPFVAIDRLRDAMQVGGLAIVSVPFCFPHHPSPEDCWRFTPTGLRYLFSPPKGSEEPTRWEILECEWRLDIPAEAGVLDIKTGRAQIIKSCYAIARAV